MEKNDLQSDELKQVCLKVSNTRFKHYKMLGTTVEKRGGEYQEMCGGDSGGPLMYKTHGPKKRWVVIGWYHWLVVWVHQGFGGEVMMKIHFAGRSGVVQMSRWADADADADTDAEEMSRWADADVVVVISFIFCWA